MTGSAAWPVRASAQHAGGRVGRRTAQMGPPLPGRGWRSRWQAVCPHAHSTFYGLASVDAWERHFRRCATHIRDRTAAFARACAAGGRGLPAGRRHQREPSGVWRKRCHAGAGARSQGRRRCPPAAWGGSRVGGGGPGWQPCWLAARRGRDCGFPLVCSAADHAHQPGRARLGERRPRMKWQRASDVITSTESTTRERENLCPASSGVNSVCASATAQGDGGLAVGTRKGRGEFALEAPGRRGQCPAGARSHAPRRPRAT